MPTIQPYIAAGRVRETVVGRTPEEFGLLVSEIQAEPDTWHIYSIHLNMGAAHNRASQLRGPATPFALLPFMENVRFKAMRHETYGPVVAVRWCSTPS